MVDPEMAVDWVVVYSAILQNFVDVAVYIEGVAGFAILAFFQDTLWCS